MTEPKAPRILLADDHALIRDALPAFIRRRLPLAEFELVSSAPAVLAAVAGQPWDLVVLDLGLPGASEFSTLRRVRELQPRLPVLVLSMHAEEKMGLAALDAGADGYLCKTADGASVAGAVAETLAGRGYRSPRLQALLARRTEQKSRTVALSPRELEVLVELGAGRSNKEIAAKLGVSVTSVGTYRTRIMEKLGLETTADLLRYVVEHRLSRN